MHGPTHHHQPHTKVADRIAAQLPFVLIQIVAIALSIAILATIGSPVRLDNRVVGQATSHELPAAQLPSKTPDTAKPVTRARD